MVVVNREEYCFSVKRLNIKRRQRKPDPRICVWSAFGHVCSDTHLCWALRRLKRGLKCILGLTWHVSHWAEPVERRSHKRTCQPQQSLPHQTTRRHAVYTHYFCVFFLSPRPTFVLCLILVLSPAAIIYPENESISFHFSVRWWPCDARSWGVTHCCVILSGRSNNVEFC